MLMQSKSPSQSTEVVVGVLLLAPGTNVSGLLLGTEAFDFLFLAFLGSDASTEFVVDLAEIML